MCPHGIIACLPQAARTHCLLGNTMCATQCADRPVGMGPQTLYNLSARLRSSDGACANTSDPPEGCFSGSAVRRVGFRTLALVTGNDTDAAWVAANAEADGNANGDLGMLFRQGPNAWLRLRKVSWTRAKAKGLFGSQDQWRRDPGPRREPRAAG